MRNNIHQRKANKLILYGLLLMVLFIGVTGPLLATLDDDENLGITFLEVSINPHHDVHNIGHVSQMVSLIRAELPDSNSLVEHIAWHLKSTPRADVALASLSLPLRR